MIAMVVAAVLAAVRAGRYEAMKDDPDADKPRTEEIPVEVAG